VELVSYMGRLSGMSRLDAIPRGHEILDFVGLFEQRYRPISTYSTGMKQRVKLAQALVHDPSIIFLDEPTSGMDPLGREEMLDLIRRIAASDKSVLLSSHILYDVERLCQNVVIISNGKLVAQGNVDALLSQGEGRKRVVVRGQAKALQEFVAQLGIGRELVTVSEEFGQMTVVMVDRGGSGDVFDLAKRIGVQVRSYLPDRLTLEDLFIDKVREVH